MPIDQMDSSAPIAAPGPAGIEDMGSLNEKVAHLVSEITKHPDMPTAEKKKKVMAAFNLLDETAAPVPVEEPPMEEPPVPVSGMEDDMDKEREEEEKEKKEEEKMEESISKLRASSDPSVKQLAESIDTRLKSLRSKRRELKLLKEAQAIAGNKTKARKLCEESALPREQITDLLVESMAARKSEPGMRAILEDRLAVVNVKRPTSGPGFVGRKDKNGQAPKEASDLKSFVEAINKR